MSDFLAAAAAAVGGPEELIMRSARARAEASGSTVDDILNAWAGGQAAPIATQPAGDAAPTPSEPATATEPSGTEAEPAAAEAPEPSPEPAATPAANIAAVVVARAPGNAAPVLTGRIDRPLRTLGALVALFVFGALFAVAFPAADARSIAAAQVPGTTPQLSDLAVDGHAVYVREGCMYCHTQQVRTVVTDVDLGTVTEPGTNPAVGPSVLGTERIGPDLTHVGSRPPTDNPAYLRELLENPQGLNPGSLMPAYQYLSPADVDALVQYLVESK